MIRPHVTAKSGMVICRLRQIADRVDQHQRRRPTIGLVDAAGSIRLRSTSRAAPSAARRSGLVVGCLFSCHRSLQAANDQLPISNSQRQAIFLEVGNWKLVDHHITTPPPTRIVWPVRNAAAGDARNTAAPATSSGVPHRASGVESATASRDRIVQGRAEEVSIHPARAR